MFFIQRSDIPVNCTFGYYIFDIKKIKYSILNHQLLLIALLIGYNHGYLWETTMQLSKDLGGINVSGHE